MTVVYTPVDLERKTAQIRVTAEIGPPVIVTLTADPAVSTAAWTPNVPGAGGMRGALPTRIDFGCVPLLRRAERPLTISNEGVAPVDYRVSFLKPHQEFSVEPTAGTVVPGSSVTFTLSYAPITMTTGVAELLVATSLPGLAPARLTLSGSSVPGAVRDAALQEQQQQQTRSQQLLGGEAQSLGDASSPTLASQLQPEGGGSGARLSASSSDRLPRAPPHGTSLSAFGSSDPLVAEEQLLLRPGRGQRFSRADPGQLLLEERLQAYKAAQARGGRVTRGACGLQVALLLILPGFSPPTQERKLVDSLAARAAAKESDAAILSAGGAGEEESRLLLLARKHAARAAELASGLVQVRPEGLVCCRGTVNSCLFCRVSRRLTGFVSRRTSTRWPAPRTY